MTMNYQCSMWFINSIYMIIGTVCSINFYKLLYNDIKNFIADINRHIIKLNVDFMIGCKKIEF